MSKQKNPNPTERENQVARLYILGSSYGGIGKILNIKSATAHTHIKNIYAKTNCTNKFHLAAYCLNNKLCTQKEFIYAAAKDGRREAARKKAKNRIV